MDEKLIDEVKHSPGPWRICVGQYRRVLCGEQTGSLERYVTDCGIDSRIPFNEQLANARLIATAPDLLETLEAFERTVDIWLPSVVSFEHEGEAAAMHQLRNRTLAAIAKAKGAGDG